MTSSETKKIPIQEFHLDKILQGLNLNQNEVRHTNVYFNVININIFAVC